MRKNWLIIDLTIIIISVLLVCSNMYLSVFAEKVIAETENISYKFTLDDDFADDCVLVVLTQEESLKFKEYTPTDFSEIKCKNIKGLATTKFNKGKRAVESIAYALNNNKVPTIDKSLDLSKYNNILCLELETPGKQNVLDAITELKKRDDILFAEPNYTISLMVNDVDNTASMTDDIELYYKYQLGLSDEFNGRDARRLVNFEDVIKIGVIDSGISRERELKFHVSAYSVDFNVYDDYDSDIDYVPSDISDDRIDVNGHGTHVAGIIASTIDRSFYFETTNYTHISEFISVRAFYKDGTAELDNIICAIDYLSKRGVPIINFSAGAYLPFQYATSDSSLRNAIENFDGLFVCAAGNGDINGNPVDLDTTPLFPAAWDMDNLITVGASDSSDELYDSSNFGNSTVDIFAPGEDIYSCFPLGDDFCDENTENCPNSDTHISYGYHKLSGTSMATGFVTGVAALVMQAYIENASPEDPDVTPEIIKDYIMCFADDWAAAYENKCVCNGRLDAYAAVSKVIEELEDPEDEGPCMHEARYYNYTSTTHTQYCAYCDEQVGTPQAHRLMRMNESNPTYHTVMCTTCGYSTIESHSCSYVNSDTSRHLKYCTVCNYNGFENHVQYVKTVYASSCVIGCLYCTHSIYCDCIPNYRNFNESVHWVDCPDGEFSFPEEHNFNYLLLPPSNSNRLYYHHEICGDCGASYQMSHTWITVDGGAECAECGMEGDLGFGEVMSLPDEELELYLASLTDEELEAFLASLPEDQLDRVTAILPPENDGELVTE